MKNFNLPQTYKAVMYNLFGNPSEVLKIVRLEIPTLQDNEILVQMHACAINPSDLLTIRGRYPDRVEFPKIAGFEGVGTVCVAGNANNNHLISKRVLALKGKGTWQEYNIIPAQEAILIPDEIDNRTAAQLYINPLTCWLMLVDKLKIDKSDTLVINAGNSICGHIIAGFFKSLGFDLISIVRSVENKVKLEQLGLKKVINSNEEDITKAIFKFTNNKGVDYALDAIGGDAGATLLKAVNPGGKFLQYGLMSGQQLPASFFTDAMEKNVQFEFYHLRDWVYSEPVNYRQQIFKQMIKSFVMADIKMPIDTEYNIDQIAEAVTMAESEGRNGKILLNFELNTSSDTAEKCMYYCW
ncbi:MAG: zinc-dependent alcohol dehydrogenase family protein [Candidatus Tisiphia sp.]